MVDRPAAPLRLQLCSRLEGHYSSQEMLLHDDVCVLMSFADAFSGQEGGQGLPGLHWCDLTRSSFCLLQPCLCVRSRAPPPQLNHWLAATHPFVGLFTISLPYPPPPAVQGCCQGRDQACECLVWGGGEGVPLPEFSHLYLCYTAKVPCALVPGPLLRSAYFPILSFICAVLCCAGIPDQGG